MRSPLASVIIPTYNYEGYIAEAVDSVLAQTFPAKELEIIIVDDGSSDDTKEKVAEYGDRVRYIFQPNTGKAGATRKGIELARGKYIFNLDADDIFFPERVRAAVEVFEKEKNVVHVAHPALYWDTSSGRETEEKVPEGVQGKTMGGRSLLAYMYQRNMLVGGGSTFSARAETLKKLPTPDRVNMLIDEYLVMFTLMEGDSYFCAKPLSAWRMHKGQYSRSGNTKDGDRKRERLLQQNRQELLDIVTRSSAPEEIKILYALKTRIHGLYLKELDGEKTLSDIGDLWMFLWKNWGALGGGAWRGINCYAVLNRSLPCLMTRLIRTVVPRRDRSGGVDEREEVL